MAEFRKKPVVIEARQFDGTPENGGALVEWMDDNGVMGEYHTYLYDNGLIVHPAPYLRIPTLEGVMVASVGDWVIRGVAGEFYPCKPGIFTATYEPSSEPELALASLDADGRGCSSQCSNEMVTLPRRDLVWLLLWAYPGGGFGPERAAHIATAAGIDLLEEAEAGRPTNA